MAYLWLIYGNAARTLYALSVLNNCCLGYLIPHVLFTYIKLSSIRLLQPRFNGILKRNVDNDATSTEQPKPNTEIDTYTACMSKVIPRVKHRLKFETSATVAKQVIWAKRFDTYFWISRRPTMQVHIFIPIQYRSTLRCFLGNKMEQSDLNVLSQEAVSYVQIKCPPPPSIPPPKTTAHILCSMRLHLNQW
eukprot:gb/GEZJ01001833.1/.p1 GENE.gb/GEZJ01001833.1/~~gb/GEZJ01001833.1/.p1  ORF type:complete len:191 (-),score=13.72 gb/GEZJ01001833.1/:786-1358(-)